MTECHVLSNGIENELFHKYSSHTFTIYAMKKKYCGTSCSLYKAKLLHIKSIQAFFIHEMVTFMHCLGKECEKYTMSGDNRTVVY